MLLRPLPVPHPDELVNFKSPGPKPGSNSCSQAGGATKIFSYPMFRDLEARADQLHRHRRASQLRRQHRLPGHVAERRRPARVRQLLPGARPDAGARPAVHARGRQDDRHPFRRGAQPRLLAHAILDESGRAERDARRQRPGDDDRRRGAARIHRHDARQRPRHLRAADDARPDAAGIQRLPEPAPVLGVSVRAPEAGRLDRAGDRRHQRPVSRDPQRRRSAAAEGHERADDGALQGQGDYDRARQPRSEQLRQRSAHAARSSCSP